MQAHNIKRGWAGVAIALAAQSAAQAESLFIHGFYPAPYRDASLVESIEVQRFDGNEGAALTLEVERQITTISVEGRPWFDVVAAGARQPSVARMTGVANVGLDEQFYKQNRTECVERDAADKCVRKEDRPIRCTRRIINLTASIRLAHVEDGRILYSVQKPKRDESSHCADQSASSTPDEIVDRLIKDAARAVRSDLAPFFTTDKIKVMEERKGMPKDVADRFKMAVKYTKRSPETACTLFAELNQQQPGFGPIAYDVALCAEMKGQLDEAEALYLKAQPLLARDTLVAQGLSRLSQRRAANADLAERRVKRGG